MSLFSLVLSLFKSPLCFLWGFHHKLLYVLNLLSLLKCYCYIFNLCWWFQHCAFPPPFPLSFLSHSIPPHSSPHPCHGSTSHPLCSPPRFRRRWHPVVQPSSSSNHTLAQGQVRTSLSTSSDLFSLPSQRPIFCVINSAGTAKRPLVGAQWWHLETLTDKHNNWNENQGTSRIFSKASACIIGGFLLHCGSRQVTD